MTATNIECVKQILEQRIEFIQRTMDERRTGMNLALELNVKELQRRLDLIGVETDRLRLQQGEYLPRELYDQTHHAVSEALTKLQTDYAYIQGRGQVISAIVSFGISLVIAGFSVGVTKIFGGH